ncbi:hypothetical protein BPAE_0026g00100 [Botrytis paeoniae]|uniref:Uncharacterized protein n=1 Tax=Botrytis paeoniae TaxID=278948 RepID=A0A4Z1G3I8_9HELO|nr:hypothetical protein BPAE_0026g00100 [Botrytis paeoniae]
MKIDCVKRAVTDIEISLSDNSLRASISEERSGIRQSLSQEHRDWAKTVGLGKYIKLAVENAHSAVLEVILLQHVDSNERHFAYALGKAASMGDHQLVVSILNQKDRSSPWACYRAFGLAAMRRNIPIMDTLYLKIGAYNKDIQELLLKLAASGHNDGVRFLIKKGANVNHQFGRNRFTPLYKASEYGRMTVVTTLLQAGAHLDHLSKNGTALNIATRQVNKKVVALLLKAGADPNASSGDSCGTALQEAIKRENKAIIDLLIEKGAEVNASSSSSCGTALQEAIKRENKAIIDLLIERGAEVNAPANRRSGTALQEAVKKGNEWIITKLIQLGADVNASGAPGSYWHPNPGVAIQEAIRSGDQTIVDTLLLAGANVKVPADENCGTPLQEAVRNGDEYMVKQLIDLGVDVNALAVTSPRGLWETNCNPESAIRKAVKKGNQEILEMLIQAGAVDPKEG